MVYTAYSYYITILLTNLISINPITLLSLSVVYCILFILLNTCVSAVILMNHFIREEPDEKKLSCPVL